MTMAGVMVGHRIIHLASTVVLARLLDPDDFGRVDVVVVVLVILGQLAGLGMSQAVIHNKRDTAKVAFHGFSVTAVAGLVAFGALALSAETVAGLLDKPYAAELIRVMSVWILLNSLTMVPLALLEKGLRFGRVGALTLVSELTYIGTALVLAYLGYGFLSLAYAFLARGVCMLGLSWTLSPGWSWLVRTPVDPHLLKELISYGLRTVSSSGLALINSSWDNLLVGVRLGDAALGFYGRSYLFVNLIKSLNDSVSRVLFPSYTRIAEDQQRLRNAYITGVRFVSLITVPAALGIFAIAPELVSTALGEKWLPAVPALQILAFMSVVRPLSGTTAPLFLAVNRPGNNIRVSLVHTAIMIPLGLALVSRGITGVAVAIVTAYTIGFFYNIHQVQVFLPRSATSILRAIVPALVCGSVMVLAVMAAKQPLASLLGDHDIIQLIVLLSIGAITYFLTLLITNRALVVEALDLFKKAIGARAKSGG